MQDILIPKNNEDELIEFSKKLRFNEIILCYDSNKKEKEIENIKNKFNNENFSIKTALIGKNNNLNKKFHDYLFIEAEDENRKYFENNKIDLIFNLELNKRKDYIHNRNSGLNQVLCKLAFQKEISIGISLKNILFEKNIKKEIILGRIMQNIKLCKKYKIDINIYSFAQDIYEMRDTKDIQALKRILKIN
jgi:RNase P/RNase MRP subunit p30